MIMSVPAKYIPLHHFLQHSHSIFFQYFHKSNIPVIRHHFRGYSRHKKHFFSLCLKHQFGRQLSALRVVAPYQRNLRSQVTVNRHDRFHLLPVFLNLKTVRRRYDPIHHVPFKHVQIFLFPSADTYGITDHRLISLFIQFHLDMLNQGRKKGMLQIRHDHAYDSRLVMVKIPCQLIRSVFELLRRLLNLLPRLRRDIARSIQRP